MLNCVAATSSLVVCERYFVGQNFGYNLKMFPLILLLLYASQTTAYGYDSGGDQGACGRQYRSGRMHRPPCDLGGDGYCTSAGTGYPWHAVRRFVRENQGLMRRMYGDQRHGQVLRAELIDEDVYLNNRRSKEEEEVVYSRMKYEDRQLFAKQDFDFNLVDNELFPSLDPTQNGGGGRETNEPRFLRDEDISNEDVLNTKFVYSEEPAISIKLGDLKSAPPYFRPTSTTQRSTTTGTKSTTVRSSTLSTTTTDETPKVRSTTSGSTTQQVPETEETVTEGKNVLTETTEPDEDITIELLTTDSTTGQSIAKVASDGSSTPDSSAGATTLSSTSSSEALSDDDSADSSDEQDASSETQQSGTVLFQDMEDPNKNKVNVNYQMRGVNACPVKEEVVAPFWANNTRGEVLALLNMYPFEQYVHWEKCTHEHRQMYCRDGCRCEQQYRLHRLLAYDPNNECRGIFSDWFRFPSCCICKCYSIPPAEFRVTSRSPRANNININNNINGDNNRQSEQEFGGLPDWYMRKNRAVFESGDHG